MSLLLSLYIVIIVIYHYVYVSLTLYQSFPFGYIQVVLKATNKMNPTKIGSC